MPHKHGVAPKIMVQCGTMSHLARWECMRNPTKSRPTYSKKQRMPLATRRTSLNRSRKGLPERTRKAAAPRTSPKVQELAAQADTEVLTRPSATIEQVSHSGTVPASGRTVRRSEVGDHENLRSRTGIVEQRCRVLRSGAAFTNGVSAISMEWFNLMLRCTERSLGAIYIHALPDPRRILHCAEQFAFRESEGCF